MPNKHRRAREGRTDYRRRLSHLKGRQPRLVVRRTLNNITASIVRYEPDGDNVIASYQSSNLRKRGWKHATGNLPAAYLTGYLAAKRAIEHGINEAILDIGRHPPIAGTRIFAALKGALDAGMHIPHAANVLPTDERLKGAHIEAHLKKKITDDIETIKNT